MNLLEKLQRDRPLDFHERMHELYNLVVYVYCLSECPVLKIDSFRGVTMTSVATKDIENGAFNIIDF